MNLVGMLVRGIVTLVDDTKKVQQVQAELLVPGQAPDEIEVAMPFGFTSKPPKSVEAIFGAIGASRANTVLMGWLDRARPKGLEDGEAGLHYLGEFKVFLKNDGSLRLGSKDATKLIALAEKIDGAFNALVNAAPVPNDGGAAIQAAVRAQWAPGDTCAATNVYGDVE